MECSFLNHSQGVPPLNPPSQGGYPPWTPPSQGDTPLDPPWNTVFLTIPLPRPEILIAIPSHRRASGVELTGVHQPSGASPRRASPRRASLNVRVMGVHLIGVICVPNMTDALVV